jgi:ATP-dependent DNA helicase RecG
MVITELKQLDGVGPKLIEKLNKLGVVSPLDLLFHLPMNYQDRTRITPMRSLHLGQSPIIEGEIVHAETVLTKRRMLLCHITDHTAVVTLRFFHFGMAQYRQMIPGHHIRAFGDVKRGKKGFEMMHPDYALFDADDPPPLEKTLTPLYPLTEGLTQKRIRFLIEQTLQHLPHLPELLPKAVREHLKLPALADAISFVHQPPQAIKLHTLLDGSHPMVQRLCFEELLAQRLSVRQLRRNARKNHAPECLDKKLLTAQLIKALPFTLTGAQQRCISEISADMASHKPMLRLLQGDVGSGKTLVALMAMLQAIENGHQAALMAPTEILAEQHYQHFCDLAGNLGLNTVFLTGGLGAKQKRENLEAIANGSAGLIVGTQALFQQAVEFASLGLVIVDEQHRFGVAQRYELMQKAQGALQAHQLIMSATPIPRTLAMTRYADLDVSIIDELPPGRTPIKTLLVSDSRRGEIVERIAHACKAGKQVYWVCTLIEESDVLECQAAEKTAEHLKHALPGIQVGLIHGRMKADEKATTMHAFAKGEISLLVATTVIEVGVNVPNASLMVIENPERLGLAQLHQLRGRVGRGTVESFCVLLFGSELSYTAKSRLKVIHDSTDGFKIAEADLKIRGPGEVLGTKQTGDMQFKVADLLRDTALLPQVQQCANLIEQQHPDAIKPLVERWIGRKQVYQQV